MAPDENDQIDPGPEVTPEAEEAAQDPTAASTSHDAGVGVLEELDTPEDGEQA